MRVVADRQRLARKAGWAVYQAGELQAVAAALDVHHSQPSRWRNAAQHGTPFRSVEFVAAVARSPELDVWPFIVMLKAEAKRAEFENASDHDLIVLWHALVDRTPLEDANEVRASRGPCREAYRAALVKESASQIRLAAVDEELERREVEPRDYDRNGLLLRRDP